MQRGLQALQSYNRWQGMQQVERHAPLCSLLAGQRRTPMVASLEQQLGHSTRAHWAHAALRSLKREAQELQGCLAAQCAVHLCCQESRLAPATIAPSARVQQSCRSRLRRMAAAAPAAKQRPLRPSKPEALQQHCAIAFLMGSLTLLFAEGKQTVAGRTFARQSS